jgi:predicted lipoprotein with Yx(FWY)xxD motif
MRRTVLALTGPALLAAVLAGCGSSSKTASHAAPAPTPAGSPASSSSGGGSGYGGSSYGGGSSGGAATGSTATPIVLTTKHAKLGTILAAGSKRMTVYLFEADKAGASACTGACASVWPPVTGSAHVAGAAMASELGTIKRSDGTAQLTYKGHPLYYYSRDKDDGDAYGEGIKSFGAEWYVLAPSGKKVDKS